MTSLPTALIIGAGVAARTGTDEAAITCQERRDACRGGPPQVADLHLVANRATSSDVLTTMRLRGPQRGESEIGKRSSFG